MENEYVDLKYFEVAQRSLQGNPLVGIDRCVGEQLSCHGDFAGHPGDQGRDTHIRGHRPLDIGPRAVGPGSIRQPLMLVAQVRDESGRKLPKLGVVDRIAHFLGRAVTQPKASRDVELAMTDALPQRRSARGQVARRIEHAKPA